MTSLDLAFAACGLLAVVAGLLAVTTRQVVHAALWLVVALLGVAGCLLVLGHELVALVLVLVYWINRAVVLFDQLITDGQSAWVFLEFTALALPSIIRIVLPIAAFAATLYALSRMSGDSELTVMQATGTSPWRLARPVLMFGLIAALLVSILAHVLVPASLVRLNARQSEIAQTATARLLREGEFISPTKGLTLPLMSYGGSAILTVMICLGLLMSFERQQRTRSTLS